VVQKHPGSSSLSRRSSLLGSNKSTMRSFLNIFAFYGLIALALGSVSEQDLFPFGPDNGDTMVPSQDDAEIGPIKLLRQITVYDDTYASVYVNTNGLITFDPNLPALPTPVCPRPKQETGEYNLVQPYWADVDISQGLGGAIYYRVSNDKSLEDRAATDIIAANSWEKPNFNVTGLFIATWDGVPFYGAKDCGLTNRTVPRNTFQAIVASSNAGSYALFYYTDIQWTTGGKSGGDCKGLGGSPAMAGWVADNTEDQYETIPGACTDQILNIAETSNYNSLGKYVFRLEV
jgi:hypothetical protein